MVEITLANLKKGEYPDVPIKITDSDFNELIKRFSLVVVDLWAPWCGPCKTVAPIVENLAKKYHKKIVFCKMNTDENGETPMKFGVMAIPTLLVFKNGNMVEQIVGAMSEKKLTEKITSYL
ncbi:MAG: thioredoxin [Candidatus Thermoplasmatota archaeon]